MIVYLRLIVCFFSAAAAIIYGQTPGINTAEIPRANGTLDFQVGNASPQSITAIAVEGRSTHLSGGRKAVTKVVQFHDSVIDPFFNSEVKPGGSRVFTLFSRSSSGTREVSLKAAIFSDGTAAGDPHWVDLLLRRRKVQYEELTAAVQRLQSAALLSTPREELLNQLRSARIERMKASKEIAERQIVDLAYQNIINNLLINPKRPVNEVTKSLSDDMLISVNRIRHAVPSLATQQ